MHADYPKFEANKYFINSSFLKLEFCEVFRNVQIFFKTILISRFWDIFYKSKYFAKSRYFVFVGERARVCKVKDVKFNRKCEDLRSPNFCLANTKDRKSIFDEQIINLFPYRKETSVVYEELLSSPDLQP